MKKSLITLSLVAVFSSFVQAETINLGARDFVEDMGNGVILHKHYDPRTKEWTSEYKVLDKEYTFVFGNKDTITIKGAEDYQATVDGLNEAMNGRPEGSPNYGIDRPTSVTPTVEGGESPSMGVDSTQGQIDSILGQMGSTDDRLIAAEQDLYATKAQTAKNTADINKLFGEVKRLDDRIDSVGAMTQAITAARPQLFSGQTSAIGAGVGMMGSSQAISVGYAHRISDNWSANANVSTTVGNDVDFSAGAGVSYAW